MSVLDDPELYKKNPLYYPQAPSDYSVFYSVLLLCSLLALFLLVLNVYFCCFSKYRQYWIDSNTGNRWILPIWVKSPAHQTPLDLKELEYVITKSEQPVYYAHAHIAQEYCELQKKESDI